MDASATKAVQRFGTISLQVSDLERSVHFYRDSLGLGFDNYVSGSALGAKVGEVLLLLHRDSDSMPKGKERGIGIELHFDVPDADAYFAELKERGVIVDQEPHDQPWGRAFSLMDPDGYAIEFVGPSRKQFGILG